MRNVLMHYLIWYDSAMPEKMPRANYAESRNRPASVSYADIEAAALGLMRAGDYPSVAAVRLALDAGSTTTIAEAMRRFWKNQAALNTGNPIALTRLPPEFADAAVDLWEQALRLSLQTARADDNAARSRLEELRRDTDVRARSLELREKNWDMAARLREQSLAEARDHINTLMKELAADRDTLRGREARIADLESQVEAFRQQLATVITRAVKRNKALGKRKPGVSHKSPAAPVRRTVNVKKPRRKLKAKPPVKKPFARGRRRRNR